MPKAGEAIERLPVKMRDVDNFMNLRDPEPTQPPPDIEGLLSALLRGEHLAWSDGQDDTLVAAFLAHAEHHGVLPLLHHFFQAAPGRDQAWPQAVLDASRQQAIAHTMWELRHQYLLSQVLEALNAAGIRPVLIKGVVLAYTLYPSPALRTRSDCDLIIAPPDRFRAAEILESLGFSGHSVSCDFLSYEASFTREEDGAPHMLDLHWRIHYSQVQSRLIPYATLLLRARPLPALCPAALGVDPVYALLIACLHRANDLCTPQWDDDEARYGQERLIWLYDLHLLIQSMSPQQLSEFTSLAEQKGLREICWDGIRKAQDRFNTRLPASVVDALSRRGPTEPVIRYQHSGMLRQRWMDWLALGSTRDRVAYLNEHLLPPADYMAERFPDSRGTWLPLLHARRLTKGIVRRLRIPRR